MKLYREGGPRAFFAEPARRRGSKLTPEVLEEAQRLLDQGVEVPEAARRLGILTNTLHKAIRAGRLVKRGKKKTKVDGRPRGPRARRASAA